MVGSNDLSRYFTDRTTDGIAGGIVSLLDTGLLRDGDRLPSVRDLARALGVSPVTVSHAWQLLRDMDMIASRGRNGTVIKATSDAVKPARYSSALNAYSGTPRFDVRLGIPDVTLLPKAEPFLRDVSSSPGFNDYNRPPIIRSLEHQARQHWEYDARELLAANGGYDAVSLGLHAFVKRHERVLVESPATPRLLDLIDSVGAHPVEVACDSNGPIPEDMKSKLSMCPSAMVVQPGVGNPTGRTIADGRAAELYGLLSDFSKSADGRQFRLIEDDSYGMLYPGTVRSAVGAGVPGIYIRGYSKSHGPDLRLAIVEGNANDIARVRSYFAYGAGWVSRILQEALAGMLASEEVNNSIDVARTIYDRRYAAMHTALRQHDVICEYGKGFNLWIPVHDEGMALISLASQGIAATPGSSYYALRPQTQAFIRVSVSNLEETNAEEVAASIAVAAKL